MNTKRQEIIMPVENNEPSANRQKAVYYNAFEEYRDEQILVSPSPLPTTSILNEDEYERWQQDKASTDSACHDPIRYWHARRQEYPRLSRMALDILTIQPMSAERERLFSTAGRIVTPLRSRLDANTIGMAQTLRSWLRAGLIDELDLSYRRLRIIGATRAMVTTPMLQSLPAREQVGSGFIVQYIYVHHVNSTSIHSTKARS